MTNIIIVVLSVLIGYLLGTYHVFRGDKQKAYIDILWPIIKVAYDPKVEDQIAFAKAIANMWIYGNKKVTQKLDKVISYINNPDRGNVTNALQEAIIEVRSDIQLWPFKYQLKPKDVRHLYTKINEVIIIFQRQRTIKSKIPNTSK